MQPKVRFPGISPMIWRRVQVPASTTLRELHGILQVAMGWDEVHPFLPDVCAVWHGLSELHAANPDVSLQLCLDSAGTNGSRTSTKWGIAGNTGSALK